MEKLIHEKTGFTFKTTIRFATYLCVEQVEPSKCSGQRARSCDNRFRIVEKKIKIIMQKV